MLTSGFSRGRVGKRTGQHFELSSDQLADGPSQLRFPTGMVLAREYRSAMWVAFETE